jgi:glycosyltransferase involved in cell wall biosynthesis
MWQQLIFPFLLKRERVDVLFSPNDITVLLTPCKTVVTIHDVRRMIWPSEFKAAERWYYKVMVSLSAKKADAILTVSRTSLRDITRVLGVPSSMVRMTYDGLDAIFHKKDITDAQIERTYLAQKYGIHKKYVLFVGQLIRIKNITSLIGAFSLLRGFDEYQLVLAGSKGDAYRAICESISTLGLNGRTILTGWVDDHDLPILYRHAEVFVFPSFYEGFGIPVIEAMASGVPVITSNLSSLAEIAEGSALLVEPRDVGQLADALQGVLEDGVLREELIHAGLTRASRFSWEEAARITVKTLENVACGKQDAVQRP